MECSGDRTMIALTMTFAGEPMAKVMSFLLVGDDKPPRLCKHCQKVFLSNRANAAFCSARCKISITSIRAGAKIRKN